jgi:hypothetical protein
MNWLQIILRVVHILGAIFWGGTVFFNALFLFPSMRDAGPDSAKIGMELMRRRFTTVMPVVAILTLLAGAWLLARASGGSAAYMRTGPGIAYSIGATAGIIALIIGATVMAPSMNKAMALSQSAATAAPAERERWLGAAAALRARAGKAGVAMAFLLVIAATCMAVARYA